MQGDLADQMVAGIDRFLLREIDAIGRRSGPGTGSATSRSADKYNASVAPNRARLAKIIGAHDAARTSHGARNCSPPPTQPALVGRGERLRRLCRSLAGGPRRSRRRAAARARATHKPMADVVAIPDADQTPEQLAGLADGIAPKRSSPAGWPKAAAA